MRNVIKIVAILALLGSRGAIAQTVGTARSPAGSPTTVTAPFSLTQDTRLIDGAPVGHRQPHVRDVPTQIPAIWNASRRRMPQSIASSPSAAAAETMMAVNNGAFADSKQLNKQLKMGAARKRESVLVRPLGCCGDSSISMRGPFPCISVLSRKSKVRWMRQSLERRWSGCAGGIPRCGLAVVDDAETGPAFYRIDNPIELHSAPAETAADWRWVVERELSLPFRAFPGPLMRATALWASDGTSIVLTFHHAIVDALSGTRILQDVMRAIAGESLEVLPPLPPVEEMIAGFAPSPVFRRGGLFARRYLESPRQHCARV